MKIIAISAVIAGAFLLNACATSGNSALENMDQVTLDQHLVKGKSTKADVLNYLGAASSTMKVADDDSEVWGYNFSNAQASGKTFIPILGLTRGGEARQTKMLTIVFNSKGIVIRDTLSFSNSNVTIGY